jgi:hypothetical protein
VEQFEGQVGCHPSQVLLPEKRLLSLFKESGWGSVLLTLQRC